MKFVSINDLKNKSADIWRDLPDELEMVVTRDGRPVAILVAVNESILKQSLAAMRRNRAIRTVAQMQRKSVSSGTDAISPADIEAETTAVRTGRHT